MRESLFQPTVTLDDAGRVTINWAGSYVQTSDHAGVTYDNDVHVERMDDILGVDAGLSPADQLRRLADYLDQH